MQNYSRSFFENRAASARQSAQVIVPMVLEYVAAHSVVDVGCGRGEWLKVFEENGVDEITGIDGEYVALENLTIPAAKFLALDLTSPVQVPGRYDLVISLEVAEHLPSVCAQTFVDSLVRLGPVILFSAAIPLQGGSHHLNEQWPNYWVALFEERGYSTVDCLRERLWKNEQVEWWYAQNIIFFVQQGELGNYPKLAEGLTKTRPEQLALVHPRSWINSRNEIELLRNLPQIMQDFAETLPAACTFICVDDGMLGTNFAAGQRAVPFLEKDGRYWGTPTDDDSAIAELERLRKDGSQFLAFTCVSFWWFEFYSGFATYLREGFPVVRENDRVIIFDLRK